MELTIKKIKGMAIRGESLKLGKHFFSVNLRRGKDWELLQNIKYVALMSAGSLKKFSPYSGGMQYEEKNLTITFL